MGPYGPLKIGKMLLFMHSAPRMEAHSAKMEAHSGTNTEALILTQPTNNAPKMEAHSGTKAKALILTQPTNNAPKMEAHTAPKMKAYSGTKMRKVDD